MSSSSCCCLWWWVGEGEPGEEECCSFEVGKRRGLDEETEEVRLRVELWWWDGRAAAVVVVVDVEQVLGNLWLLAFLEPAWRW
jgi:hypothetical protein